MVSNSRVAKRAIGFTMIELMIVVATVAILAAIALPSYTDHVKRSKIIQATSALEDARNKLVHYYDDSATHVFTGFVCPGSTPDFTVACVVGAATFAVSATGHGPVSGFVYTIDQTDARATTITGVSGWTGNSTCWVTKKGGEC